MIKRLRYESGPIDEIDARILRFLYDNARSSIAELAREIGLSSPSVSERIRRLEEAGVIDQYSIEIDPKKLGFQLSAWLRIRPTPGQMDRVVKIIQNIPEIVECDKITGDDCFIAKAHFFSVEDMENVINKLVAYSMTNTSIIQSSPVSRRLPKLL